MHGENALRKSLTKCPAALFLGSVKQDIQSTGCSSRCMANRTCCGVRSTSMASNSTFWMQKRRDKVAAKRFFRRVLRSSVSVA
jgi:hypothetical protein